MEGLTKKEKGFADDYIETGNGTQSALKNYNTNSENMAAVIASKNIRKDKIKGYIESEVEAAKARIVELAMNAKKENVRLSANQDIIDRNEGRATQKIAGDNENPIAIKIINYDEGNNNTI